MPKMALLDFLIHNLQTFAEMRSAISFASSSLKMSARKKQPWQYQKILHDDDCDDDDGVVDGYDDSDDDDGDVDGYHCDQIG